MERLHPPVELSRWLARIGGCNVFGDPLFIVFWGQTRVEKSGFGEYLTGHGTPAWFLADWHPAEEYAPLELWEEKILGPFPSRGKYEILQPFYKREGKKLSHMPLNYRSLEMMIPMTLKHRGDSLAKRKALFSQVKEQKDLEMQNIIADRLQDSVPAWEAGSFKGITNTNSALRQKMEQIEKNYKHVVNYAAQRPMGTSTAAAI